MDTILRIEGFYSVYGQSPWYSKGFKNVDCLVSMKATPGQNAAGKYNVKANVHYKLWLESLPGMIVIHHIILTNRKRK